MKIKFLTDEDICNYKKTSMFIGFPNCSWKCDKMNCQNSALAMLPNINISKEDICERYVTNPLTKAVVLGGLEPFDSEIELISFIDTLRRVYECDDDIVIYTGYTEEELNSGIRSNINSPSMEQNMWNYLKSYKNIIVKFGRFIPGQIPHYDAILGVELASDNQYAKKIS